MKFFRKLKELEINEVDIGIGNQRIKIKPNHQNMQIAYKLWVELSTRKIGLEIDFENDVIYEIYDSWYEFFGLTRGLIKDTPISQIWKDSNTKDLVKVAIGVLNEGIRPHLTKWQARYRKWYESEIKKEETKDLSPQEIQKKYPQYQELTNEMSKVNKNLISYKDILKKIAMIEEDIEGKKI